MQQVNRNIVKVSFRELAERCDKKLNSLSKNKSYKPAIIRSGRRVLENGEKLLRRNNKVILEIPDNFRKKLGSGIVVRTRGVLRTKNAQIIKHLNDVKPSKFTKALKIANIAMLGIDILESALLDEKLKEILIMVNEIDKKLEAQNRGAYRSAIDQMIELTKHANLRERDRRVPIVLDRLSFCEHLYKELYEAKWGQFLTQKQKFQRAKIRNKPELDSMRNLAEELFNYVSIILSCKIPRIIILFQMQKEFILAQEKSYALLDYTSNQFQRFDKEIGTNELRRLKKKFKNPIRKFQDDKATFDYSGRKFKELISGSEHLLDSLILFDLTIPQYKTK